VKVTVYRFEYFDRATGSTRLSEDYATDQAIRAIRAVLQADSAMEVEDKEVTFSGLWRRIASSAE